MLLVLAGLIFGAALVFGGTISNLIWLLPVAVAIVAIAWLATAGAMPRKTDQGAEEAAKWRAFGRYLQDMQRYTNVQAAADKFQQYLPYAVAMGIDRALIRQFENVPAAMPPYFSPYGYAPVYIPYPVGGGGGYGTGGSIAGQGGPVGGPGGGPAPQFDPAGAMQGMSNSLSGAMQSMSDSFTQMVNSASNVLTSQPQSSGSSGGGGSWGGGGGSFGGGGGGGGSAGAD
jgi:uncharacterized membrane protein